MRETRNAQKSIFDFHSTHEHGKQLSCLSDMLDEHPGILELIERDLRHHQTARTGANGLTLESIFRCLLLKQTLQVSYQKLAFHLSDSPTYRTFARLRQDQFPGRSSLQSAIRTITPDTLENIDRLMMAGWVNQGAVTLDSLRIDSTVVESNIAPPRDSQLLDDAVRVLSRMMAACNNKLGVRIRFTDQRKRSKSLAFRIFNAKKADKEALYPKLLSRVHIVIKQSNRAIEQVIAAKGCVASSQAWIEEVQRYQGMLFRVIDQTQRRVYQGESVPAAEKIVSLFESHTDVIVKDNRETFYGHKVNLATQKDGFITYFSIEKGNPSDTTLYLPVLDSYQDRYDQLPLETVADGGYANQSNITAARVAGVKRAVFNKPAGSSLSDMGVKKKTFDKLRHFRAGVEGNISELKRSFGAGKARWKGEDGFNAFVWSAVLSFNLMRMVRFSSA